MKTLNIIVAQEAGKDIVNIKNYIAKDNIIAAKDFVKKLKNAFIMLSDYPKIGKSRPEFSGDKSILFLPILKNYLIVYRISNDNLYIVRILSNYQNICAIL